MRKTFNNRLFKECTTGGNCSNATKGIYCESCTKGKIDNTFESQDGCLDIENCKEDGKDKFLCGKCDETKGYYLSNDRKKCI